MLAVQALNQLIDDMRGMLALVSFSLSVLLWANWPLISKIINPTRIFVREQPAGGRWIDRQSMHRSRMCKGCTAVSCKVQHDHTNTKHGRCTAPPLRRTHAPFSFLQPTKPCWSRTCILRERHRASRRPALARPTPLLVWPSARASLFFPSWIELVTDEGLLLCANSSRPTFAQAATGVHRRTGQECHPVLLP